MKTAQALNLSLLSITLFGLLTLAGCGAESGGSASGEFASSASGESASAPASSSAASDAAATGAGASGKTSPAGAPNAPGNATAQLIQAASTVPRKIIYNATVDLLADNFTTAQRSLLGLIQKHRGYISETNIGGTPGTPREGTWKIRIPEAQFSAFMADVVKLGELQTTHTDSQDVTAEFYDLQARITNKQVEERRLIDHLKRSTAKLSDILQVERELSRVRGEIEQMQGRLRLLANMTSLTTITVTLREVKGFVAPKPTTFGSQIARSFQTSITALADFGKAIVLIIVALAPWAIVSLIIGFPLWRLLRRHIPKL